MDIENLFILLKCASTEFGENIALKSESRQLTYQQLYMQSVAVANQLPQYEGTEAVAVLDMQRGLNYCIAVFALLAAGYTVCPFDESYTDIEVKAIVSQFKPSIIMCDRNTEKRHSCVYDIKEQYIIYAEDYLTNEDRSIINSDFTFKINEVAFMIASSGSTGDLKLIECTHSAIYYAIAGINQRGVSQKMGWSPL
ncbi:D-alanine--D-alanyl carrier protein ligase [Lachnospiraceae bacterium]|nr:D-alanine--D-alanyl carrier protein ligase [Lachnospiraceae bacterium]